MKYKHLRRHNYIARPRRLTQEIRCCIYGRTGRVLMVLSEDYSEPWGNHIDQYTLCYVCRMMIHCRFHNRARLEA